MDFESVDAEALEVARKKIEDILIKYRDSRIFVIGGNGFVVREQDGSDSSIMRLPTRDGLRIGIATYLAHLESKEKDKKL